MIADPTANTVVAREDRRARRAFWQQYRYRSARTTAKLDVPPMTTTTQPTMTDDHTTREAAGEEYRQLLRDLRVKNSKYARTYND